ncbi:MAG: universal stress protein [Actinobacteria bacterium]|nr:universal stress protein [Actinomycetota bacterium]
MPAEMRALPLHERGEPVERLLERAGQGVDLLLLGSRGFGPLMRVLLGNVAARVISRTACPVMVVPRPGAGS